MADIDIDPFGEHNRSESRHDENIPLPPVTPVGGSTCEPELEQETSFRGESHTSVLHKEYLVGEIYKLIGNKVHQKLEPSLCPFKLGEDGRLYYRGKPLTNMDGQLKMIGVIADTLGIRGLREMGFNIHKTDLKPRHILDLLEKLPSTSDIAKADEIELQEIVKSMENLISQMSQTDD